MLNLDIWALVFAVLLAGFGSSALAADRPIDKQCTTEQCSIQCVDPLASCSESASVIDVLKLMAQAYTKGDMATVAQYLSEGVTTFDEDTKTLISGKEAVLNDIKHHYTNPDTPVLSYIIDHPCAQVHGDTAVVTFTAIKEIGGKHPCRLENKATDIFIKEGDSWKKLHYRGAWKKIG